MKVALVHDYLNEFGGAERVLLVLSEIWPDAPIYTAFYRNDTVAWERFKTKDIRVSWAHHIPFFNTYLHSPLRFLAPLVWGSMAKQLADYDVVISSASWYVTKGFGTRGTGRKKPLEICYCHTPPRWLYGYKTSVELQKYWPVRVYAAVVGHFMRMYDFSAAQRVNYFVANSKNVAGRIQKFYRRDATVIYPPATLSLAGRAGPPVVREDYYLVISRIVGGKGLDLAVKAAKKLGIRLKIAGKPSGYWTEYKQLRQTTGENVEFLGYVEDSELAELYAGARGFLALAKDEDFGITPVEAMLCGTPVIAFRGGGYLETVIQGKTGVFFNEYTVDSLIHAIKTFSYTKFDHTAIAQSARKFSKGRFKREMKRFVNSVVE